MFMLGAAGNRSLMQLVKYKSLLQLDADYSDSSRYAITYADVGGTSTISNTTYKFSTGSLLTSGTISAGLAGTSSELVLGALDFTLEGWLYIDTATDNGIIYLFRHNPIGVAFYIDTSVTSPTLRLQDAWSWTGTTTTVNHQTSLTKNIWHHVVIERYGNNCYSFLNGVKSTNSWDISAKTFTAQTFSLFKNSATGNSVFLDCVRVTIGDAIYRTNFTPSETPLSVFV